MGIEEIKALVEGECRSTSNAFSPAFFGQHLEQVAHYAGALGLRLGADPAVVELAAYLHDLSAVRDLATLATHADDSARIAHELLREKGFAPGIVERVCSCIEKHGAPVPSGGGSPEEICISNADVMSQIARPAYWLYYLYRVRGMDYADGVEWLRIRAGAVFSRLTVEAREIIAPERERVVQLLCGAGLDL